MNRDRGADDTLDVAAGDGDLLEGADIPGDVQRASGDVELLADKGGEGGGEGGLRGEAAHGGGGNQASGDVAQERGEGGGVGALLGGEGGGKGMGDREVLARLIRHRMSLAWAGGEESRSLPWYMNGGGGQGDGVTGGGGRQQQRGATRPRVAAIDEGGD